MLIKKIFLASSSELKEDRTQFELLINRKNKEWVGKGVFLELLVWEDFLDAVSKTRLQDEYNKAIRDCDLFVMLFFTKVGKYTEEEFEAAFGQFKATNRPFIFTYFKDAEVSLGSANKKDMLSLFAFQEKLDALGHFYTRYENIDALKLHFTQQLDKLAASGFIEFGADKAGGKAPGAPYQAPPPAADHVARPAELADLKRHLLGKNGELLPSTIGLHGFGGAGKTTLARLLCADAAVRQACRDGILWVPLGKNPPEPRAQMADLVSALTGDCSGCTTLPGARARLQAALSNKNILLVLDDVWDEAQVRDVVEASTGCARLITTRNTFTLPFEAILIDVGTMQDEEAGRLLAAGLPQGQDARLSDLARKLGCWPVLLRLANRTLRQRILGQRTSLPKALDAVESDLARKGILAFDPTRDAAERDQAVAATVEASLELLDPAERRRYLELALFPQDIPIPLRRVAELWELSGGITFEQAEDLVTTRLDPLSLVEYNGEAGTIQLHDVLRRYVSAKLPDKATLHLRLVERWGDRPAHDDLYGWRWIAFHRAQAALASDQPARHALTERLVGLVTDEQWQKVHEDTLTDPPALRDALAVALEAAIADDVPLGVPLVVRVADALVGFQRDHSRPEPVFDLARRGDLGGARRRSALFSIDEHWRQLLMLAAAWLAPLDCRDSARKLVDEIQAELAPHQALRDLCRWIRADLWGEPAPAFPFLVPPDKADEALIEELLKRVGGGQYSRELIVSRGLDPNVADPDTPPPAEGLYRQPVLGGTSANEKEERTTTRYLAELDGPYLVAYAARDPANGREALERYLSVYTNYSYPEYRFSTLWLLLGYIVQLPRTDGGQWVRECVLRILTSALSGGSVEFEKGLPIAATALRARAGDQGAWKTLTEQARRLMDEAARLKPGRDRGGSDIWAHQKRLMLATAQALGWLVGEKTLAGQVLHDAFGLADSGFAGYQAPACLALAEAVLVCRRNDPEGAGEIEQALEWAQRAAHNVQDPTFCARMTARVNAMRRGWSQGFDPVAGARRLAEAAHAPEFAALHRVGHQYTGRRPDALPLPPWAFDDGTFDGLQRLYQRPKADFLRLNIGANEPFKKDSKLIVREVAVPDPGFVPHLAARLAAEVLAQAIDVPLSAERLQLLRLLVPYAIPSPTALDAVLTRLVLAQGRRAAPAGPAEVEALDAVIARRTATKSDAPASELLAGRLPA